MPTTIENDLAELDALLTTHKVGTRARNAVVEWVKKFDQSAGIRGMMHFLNAQKDINDNRSARFDRLSNALDDRVQRRVLRHALNTVNGGPKGTWWSNALSDELEQKADDIITGSDEDLKARLIAACKEYRL